MEAWKNLSVVNTVVSMKEKGEPMLIELRIDQPQESEILVEPGKEVE